MRLTRLYVEAPLESGASLELPEAVAAHVVRVLRMGVGDACALFDGRGGEHRAVIEAVTKRSARVAVGERRDVHRESPLRVLLLQGLARGERMDLVVQKATELGVAAIRPIHTQYSGVKLDETQVARKVAHWRGVAIGAAEQCGRDRVPEILTPLALDRALVEAPSGTKLLLSTGTDEAPAPPLTRSQLAAREDWITLLVGPEGGFADAEESLAKHAGFAPIGLGPRVLRTETAGPAALAAIGALAGDLARE